jgi:hypothetical protein
MARAHDAATEPGHDLASRIAEVYAGPLASFVARRDALARELRSAGRRDEATDVKALRKPRALAWALDAGAAADPDAAAELAAAVDAMGAAQAGDGDVREAITRLRDAEAAMVEASDAAARDHDHPVDRTELAAALRAVVSAPTALAELSAGRLVDTAPPAAAADEGEIDEAAWQAVPAKTRSRRTDTTAGSPGRAGRRRSRATDVEAPEVAVPAEGPDPAELDAARRAVDAAEQAAEEAASAAHAASDEADRAEADARRASDEAAAARRRADEAADVAARARREADARAGARDDAAEALRHARAALQALDGSGRRR